MAHHVARWLRDEEAAEKLTTKVDHNSIGIRSTLSERSSRQIPASRHQATRWSYLTSEGSFDGRPVGQGIFGSTWRRNLRDTDENLTKTSIAGQVVYCVRRPRSGIR